MVLTKLASAKSNKHVFRQQSDVVHSVYWEDSSSVHLVIMHAPPCTSVYKHHVYAHITAYLFGTQTDLSQTAKLDVWNMLRTKTKWK